MAERIRVVIDGENAGLIAATTGSEAAIKSLGLTTRNESRGAAAFNAVLDRQGRNLQAIGRYSRYAAAGVGTFAAIGLAAAVKRGIQFDAQMESNTMALTQFLGSGKAAKAMLDDLFQTAKVTPFQFRDITSAARKLLAFQFTAEETKKTLQATGDAVAALGGSADTIDRVVVALGQIKAKGRVQGDELLQLAEAGIPAYDILADKLHLTSDEVKNIGKAGIEADVAIRALTEGMEKRFGEAAEIQSKTFQGQISTLQDNVDQTLGAMTQGLFDELEQWLPAVNRTATQIAAIWNRDDLTPEQKFEQSRQAIDKQLGPLFKDIENKVEALDIEGKLIDLFNKALPVLAERAGKLGLRAAGAFVRGFVESDVLGKLVIGSWLFSKMGGFAAIKAAGGAAGSQVGAGMAASAATEMGSTSFSSSVRSKMKGALSRVGPAVGIVLGAGVLSGVAKTIGNVETLPGGDKFNATVNDLGVNIGRQFGLNIGKTSGEQIDEGLRDALRHAARGRFNIGSQLRRDPEGFKALQAFNKEGADAVVAAARARDRIEKIFAGTDIKLKPISFSGSIVTDPQGMAKFTARWQKDLDVLRSGTLTKWADIKQVFQREQRAITEVPGLSGANVRKALSRNYEAAMAAIEKAMDNGTIRQNRAMKLMGQLSIQNAEVTGYAITQLADRWAAGWKNVGDITDQNITSMLKHMDRMQPAARDKFGQAMITAAKALNDKGDLPEAAVDRLVAKLAKRWGILPDKVKPSTERVGTDTVTIFNSLNTATGGALTRIITNVSNALKSLHVDDSVSFKAVGSGGNAVTALFKQRGGAIFTGKPEGDSVPALLERGEYVMNRNAVKAVGVDKLDAINFGAASRFQTGGQVGGVQVNGPDGPLTDIAQGAVDKVAKAAESYVDKKRPSGAGANAGFSGPTPAGVGTFDGKPVAEWIIPILAWARQHGWGGGVNSGYRSPSEQMAAAVAYGLEHYGPGGPLASNHVKTAYPGGAVDVTDPEGLNAVLRNYPGRPTLVWGGPVIDDYVHFSATGHMLGGLVRRMQSGGWAGPWAGSSIDKTYPISDGFTGETLPFYVAAALGEWAGLPGVTMAQIGKSENGLHPGTSIPDPPGSSHGWLAINDHYNNVTSEQMRNPIRAILKAKEIVGSGLPNSSIWHATKYVTGYDQHYTAHDPADIARHIGGRGAAGTTDTDGTKKAGPSLYPSLPLGPFGPLPDSVGACTKEIDQRRTQLKQYQDAAKAADKDKDADGTQYTKAAERIKDRIKALLAKRSALLAQRRAKFIAKITGTGTLPWFERRVEAFTGPDGKIPVSDEWASRVAALEPETFGSKGEFDAYMARESSAYGRALLNRFTLHQTLAYGIKDADYEAAKSRSLLHAFAAFLKAPGSKADMKIRQQNYDAVKQNLQGIVADKTNWLDAIRDLGGAGAKHAPVGDFHQFFGPSPAFSPAGSYYGTGTIFQNQIDIRDLGLRTYSSDSDSSSEIADLYAQLLESQSKGNALQAAHTEIFAQFFSELGAGMPYIGAYAMGTGGKRVGQTGLAILHENEQVIPDPKGPYGQYASSAGGGAGGVSEVRLTIDGNLTPLMGQIEATVDGKLSTVDKRLGRRARQLAVAPGG